MDKAAGARGCDFDVLVSLNKLPQQSNRERFHTQQHLISMATATTPPHQHKTARHNPVHRSAAQRTSLPHRIAQHRHHFNTHTPQTNNGQQRLSLAACCLTRSSRRRGLCSPVSRTWCSAKFSPRWTRPLVREHIITTLQRTANKQNECTTQHNPQQRLSSASCWQARILRGHKLYSMASRTRCSASFSP
jgi:hypothetical protein